jgi:hypothetical protein
VRVAFDLYVSNATDGFRIEASADAASTKSAAVVAEKQQVKPADELQRVRTDAAAAATTGDATAQHGGSKHEAIDVDASQS